MLAKKIIRIRSRNNIFQKHAGKAGMSGPGHIIDVNLFRQVIDFTCRQRLRKLPTRKPYRLKTSVNVFSLSHLSAMVLNDIAVRRSPFLPSATLPPAGFFAAKSLAKYRINNYNGLKIYETSDYYA